MLVCVTIIYFNVVSNDLLLRLQLLDGHYLLFVHLFCSSHCFFFNSLYYMYHTSVPLLSPSLPSGMVTLIHSYLYNDWLARVTERDGSKLYDILPPHFVPQTLCLHFELFPWCIALLKVSEDGVQCVIGYQTQVRWINDSECGPGVFRTVYKVYEFTLRISSSCKREIKYCCVWRINTIF